MVTPITTGIRTKRDNRECYWQVCLKSQMNLWGIIYKVVMNKVCVQKLRLVTWSWPLLKTLANKPQQNIRRVWISVFNSVGAFLDTFNYCGKSPKTALKSLSKTSPIGLRAILIRTCWKETSWENLEEAEAHLSEPPAMVRRFAGRPMPHLGANDNCIW